MHTSGLNAKETALHHSNEMNEMFKYDYINFIKENGEKIDSIYKMMVEKNLLNDA
jgi:hypothetical protein